MFNSNEIVFGGCMNHVVKISDTVHRRIQGHPMLHSYLLYLEEAGMPGVPRFLGIDGQGREILSYLPGKTMEHGLDGSPALNSEETIADVARFMRKLHDVSAGFLPRAVEGGWRNPYFPDEEPETILHGDPAVWNFAFIDDRVSGLFDFDQACPGARIWDLALSLFSVIPLTPYDYDPALHAAGRKRKVKLFFDAYGIEIPRGIMDLTARRIQVFVDETRKKVEAGDKNSEFGLRHYQNIVAHIKACGRDWA